jgi:hypothetical protein
MVWFHDCIYKDCIKGSENIIPSAERFRGQLNHLILRVRYPIVVNKYVKRPTICPSLVIDGLSFYVYSLVSPYVTPTPITLLSTTVSIYVVCRCHNSDYFTSENCVVFTAVQKGFAMRIITTKLVTVRLDPDRSMTRTAYFHCKYSITKGITAAWVKTSTRDVASCGHCCSPSHHRALHVHEQVAEWEERWFTCVWLWMVGG